MDNNTEIQKRVKEGFIGQKMIILPPSVKKQIVNNPLISNFYLTAIGYYPNASCHDRERKNGSSEYILIYCTEGGGHIIVNGIQHDMQANHFFIIPKNVPHRYRSNNLKPWSIYWIHFTGETAQKLYERSLINNQAAIHPIPFDENRIRLFEQIYYILEHSYGQKEMEIINFNLLHYITELIYHKENNPMVYNTGMVSKSIAFMKKNLTKKLGILELAKEQNVSRTSYSRIFKRQTGTSPVNYFNQLKIQKSCQYLYFTDRSIKDICAELGFKDQYYFSRIFRKINVISPSRYKSKYK